MGEIPEREWKVLRSVKDAALDRFCARVLDECRAVMDDESTSHHQRYLRLFRLIDERDAELAYAFDDMRRSRAIDRIAWMRHLGLYTSEEWERFSPRTRDTAQFVADEIIGARRSRRSGRM